MVIDGSHWASNCMSNWGHRGNSMSNWGHSKVGEVVSTSSGHGRLIYRDNSTIGVSDEWEDSGKRSTVLVASSIGRESTGQWGSMDQTLGSKVISTSGSHCGFIDWDNSTIGVGLETEESLGSRDRQTGGENQKLHV